MAIKKVVPARNAKTGSYTVHLQKSARSGKFVTQTGKPGRIEVRTPVKKTS